MQKVYYIPRAAGAPGTLSATTSWEKLVLSPCLAVGTPGTGGGTGEGPRWLSWVTPTMTPAASSHLATQQTARGRRLP